MIEVAVPPDCMVTPAVEPFHKIWAFVAKLFPVAVKVKSPDFAAFEVGLIEVSTGVDPAPALMLDHAVTRFIASIVPRPVA